MAGVAWVFHEPTVVRSDLDRTEEVSDVPVPVPRFNG